MIVAKAIAAAGAGLLMQAGAGCFSPTILEHDEEVVILRYGPWATVSEIAAKADSLCADYDRTAELVADAESLAEPGFREATFACLGSDRGAG